LENAPTALFILCFDIVLFIALAPYVALHVSPHAVLAFALFSTAFAAILRVIPIPAPVIPGACLYSPMLHAIPRIALVVGPLAVRFIPPFNVGSGRSSC